MKYREEELAKDLHHALLKEFSSPPTKISIEGRGVHWKCTAERGRFQCTIHCFSSLGTQYYTSFHRDSAEVATSRGPSRDRTIDAVRDWLDGEDLAVLYDRYPFIDKWKRALTRLRDETVAIVPELQGRADACLKCHHGDFYSLHYHADDRSCAISFYGENELPDAKFSWDRCPIFEFQPDDSLRLAHVLKRWICEHAPPSAMRKEFAWLKIGELADYYEIGKPVEGEFLQSWDRVEQDYVGTNYPFGAEIKSFLAELREKGYDKTLRAGKSLYFIVLSRSRRHGLRENQASIVFAFGQDGLQASLRHHPRTVKTIVSREMKLTPDIEQLLQELQAMPVD